MSRLAIRPPTLAATLVAALLASAPAPPPVEAQTLGPPEGRPVVLVLHGRGLQGQDTVGLRRDWREALADGLEVEGSGLRLLDDDVRLVWYADALDPRRPHGCPTDAATGRPVSGGAAEVVAVMGIVGSLLGLAADWVGELEAAALRSLAGDLLYFGEKRCAAEERLADALVEARREGRPVILVAHSFGSLVAYGHLRTRAPGAPPVARLVTVGSLIGYPELRELLLGPEAKRVQLPEGVGAWVNVRDPGDALAAPLMDPGGLASAVGVSDRATERRSGGDPHDLARYLSDPVTVRAVLEGWCEAAGPRAPSALGVAAACPTR